MKSFSPIRKISGKFCDLQASPWQLNNDGRTYDLDAIVSIIDSAKKFIYIHVMDYIPMLVYRQPKKYSAPSLRNLS